MITINVDGVTITIDRQTIAAERPGGGPAHLRSGRSRCHDLTGIRFGMLTALARIHRPDLRSRDARWLCICDCGRSHEAYSHNLVRGRITNCGCRRTS